MTWLTIAALLGFLAAGFAMHRTYRRDLDAEREKHAEIVAVLEEERDGLVLVCEQERERAQIAETELFGLLIDHFGATPIEAARAARRA